MNTCIYVRLLESYHLCLTSLFGEFFVCNGSNGFFSARDTGILFLMTFEAEMVFFFQCSKELKAFGFPQ